MIYHCVYRSSDYARNPNVYFRDLFISPAFQWHNRDDFSSLYEEIMTNYYDQIREKNEL